MAYLWRVPLAIVGLLMIRELLFPSGWGHRTAGHLLVALVGFLLLRPLAVYSAVGFYGCVGGGLLVLLPIRSIIRTMLVRSIESSLTRLAGTWGTGLVRRPDSSLIEVVRDSDGYRLWVGTTETTARSLHPGVARQEVHILVACVLELSSPPSLQCSVWRGWETPCYFEREWREKTVCVGDYVSMSMDGLVSDDEARETGGSVASLHPLEAAEHERLRPFAILASDGDAFWQIFENELLDVLSTTMITMLQCELNVTPSSVNMVMAYPGYETLLSSVTLVERLARRLASAQEPVASKGKENA